MRQLILHPVTLIGQTLAVIVFAWASPTWTRDLGLDFWNVDRVTRQYGIHQQTDRELNRLLQHTHRRIEATDRIALNLCDDRIELDQAVDALTSMARSDPEWLARLRYNYGVARYVSPTASDRDVLCWYLYVKLHMFRETARYFGDASRATVISERLARLEREYTSLTPISLVR